jgi:hypothetical protein
MANSKIKSTERQKLAARQSKESANRQPVCRDPLGFSMAPRGKHRRAIQAPTGRYVLVHSNGRAVDWAITEADAVLWVAEGLLP